MANTLNDVAQQRVRTFLVELGRQYDVERGVPVLGTTKRHRREIAEAFGGACAYCGVPLETPHFDHLVALNRDAGGLHAWGNVVPACKRCNDAKGSKPWDAWMAQAHPGRSQEAIRGFVAHHAYAPSADVRTLAQRLYAETMAASAERLARYVAEAVHVAGGGGAA